MKRLLVAAACALLIFPAFGQSTSEKLGVKSALGISPTTEEFLTEAVAVNLFEIRSSELAEKRGDAETKAFAAKMISDYKTINAELRTLVQSQTIDVAIPDQLSDLQKATLDRLSGLRNAKFDNLYRDNQFSAHKDAVSLFHRYAEGGANPAIKQWAQQKEPLLRHHLQMAAELDKQAKN